MAWLPVPGSNGIWEYDNAPAVLQSDIYVSANGTLNLGIRTFTPPNGGNPQQTYVKCRKVGETIERGELSKNYYDNQ